MLRFNNQNGVTPDRLHIVSKEILVLFEIITVLQREHRSRFHGTCLHIKRLKYEWFQPVQICGNLTLEQLV